eukprot:TRINITY_DN1626_c0_g1_i11.p1 TRINITY_DN1626_c0_g1~~TRINITY_DN1626_c0_g1_i11.p1  ORF type:complete len:303 (-),score=57.53 TRINITY_DN1626_c0_g1_i11:604-1440(-)
MFLRPHNLRSTSFRFFSSLPIVDISPFTKDGTASSKKEVVEQVSHACREVGFLYIKGHQVHPKLCEDMLEVARRFFGQPEEEKMKISITNSKVFRGYQQLGQNITKYQRDWHEAIDLFAEPKGVDLTIYDPSRPLHGLNQWPVYPPKFREISEKYVEAMLGLGKQIMRIMALGLELPFNYFEPFTSDPFWIFRVLGYPPTPRQNISGDFGDRDHADQMEINYGCGVHTDYGCVTIVNQDTVGGLQVQTLDGKWIDGPPLPGTFVINIGDMLYVPGGER